MKRFLIAAAGIALVPIGVAAAGAQSLLNVAQNPATAGVSSVAEDARVAYVDLDRVASLSSEGKALAARLQDLRAKKSAEVSQRSREVDALQTKLIQTGSVLDDFVKARLQREFQRAQIDFQRFSEDAQAEVQDAQQEGVESFNAKLFPVIGQLAKEKKLWAVFGSENLIWYSPAVDLTQEVAARLDAAAAPAKR